MGLTVTQTFLYVTLPNIKTILLFTLVTSLIGGLNMFDIPKLFLLGGPDNATLTTNVFIYNQAFSGSYMYNRAAAASMIMLVIIAILSGILFMILGCKERQSCADRTGRWRRSSNVDKRTGPDRKSAGRRRNRQGGGCRC